MMTGEPVKVTFEWSNEFGWCEDCGDLPANYFAPDLKFTDVTDPANPVVRHGNKLCPICAALWASYGERLERLWKDEEEDDGQRRTRALTTSGEKRVVRAAELEKGDEFIFQEELHRVTVNQPSPFTDGERRISTYVVERPLTAPFIIWWPDDEEVTLES